MSETVTMTNPANVEAARQSFGGKGLTEAQFAKAWALSSVLRAEIQERGTFQDALTDLSHAFARTEKFDSNRAEAAIRDVFQGKYAQTLNQYRESLQTKLENLPDTAQPRARAAAENIEALIRDGETQPFYKAYDAVAVTLADELQITRSAAKTLMQEAYKQAHGRDLYVHGKEIEEAYHKPVREAEIAARKVEKLQTYGRSQSMS